MYNETQASAVPIEVAPWERAHKTLDQLIEEMRQRAADIEHQQARLAGELGCDPLGASANLADAADADQRSDFCAAELWCRRQRGASVVPLLKGQSQWQPNVMYAVQS